MLIQLAFSGIVIGLFYALVGYGLSIIIKTTKNWHFAHGAVFAVGAFTFSAFFENLGMSVWGSIVLTLAITTIIGVVTEFLVYRPLRKRGADSMVTLVASLSLLGVVSNVIGLIFGLSPREVYVAGLNQVLVNFGPIAVGKWDVLVIILSLVMYGLLVLLMNKTKLGILIRAISDNPRQAQLMGVNLNLMYLLSFILGSAAVGIPSILFTIHNQLNPDIGIPIYLFAVIGVVLGGAGSLTGTMLGGLTVGILQKIAVWKLPGEWSDFIAFAVLFILIIARPQGIFRSN